MKSSQVQHHGGYPRTVVGHSNDLDFYLEQKVKLLEGWDQKDDKICLIFDRISLDAV